MCVSMADIDHSSSELRARELQQQPACLLTGFELFSVDIYQVFFFFLSDSLVAIVNCIRDDTSLQGGACCSHYNKVPTHILLL